jgi:hypothetical protein
VLPENAFEIALAIDAFDIDTVPVTCAPALNPRPVVEVGPAVGPRPPTVSVVVTDTCPVDGLTPTVVEVDTFAAVPGIPALIVPVPVIPVAVFAPTAPVADTVPTETPAFPTTPTFDWVAAMAGPTANPTPTCGPNPTVADVFTVSLVTLNDNGPAVTENEGPG